MKLGKILSRLVKKTRERLIVKYKGNIISELIQNS